MGGSRKCWSEVFIRKLAASRKQSERAKARRKARAKATLEAAKQRYYRRRFAETFFRAELARQKRRRAKAIDALVRRVKDSMGEW
jgi:hypothetical protein